MARLTQKQETFVQNLFSGMSQREAYLQAGYSLKSSVAVTDINAQRLANTTKVLLRHEELNKKAEDASVATHLEVCQVATEIIRAKTSQFVNELGIIDRSKLDSHAIQSVDEQTTMGGLATVLKLRLHNPIQAIAELAKLKKWYETEGSVIIDNRTLTINVMSDKAKSLTERLIEGERTGGDNNH